MKDFKFDHFLETNNKYNGTNTKTFIMLHHTGNKATGKQNAEYLSRDGTNVSAHVVVDKDGTTYKIGLFNDQLWHAGKGDLNGEYKDTMNLHSIGIEIVSDGYEYTEEQKKTVRKLIQYLMEEYNIPSDNIIRHADYSGHTTGKWDVGPNFYKEYGDFKNYKDSFKSGKYDHITGYEIFNDLSDNYETKRLIEIGLYRFVQDLKERKLKIRDK